LGEQVGLFDHAHVDASGDAGGGMVLIGGDFQGANPDLHNALRTYVGEDVAIVANAIETGNGGKVIVWSDQTTDFRGAIAATGGRPSGDGGTAEVSGHVNLAFRGQVDLSARGGLGHGGTLLLDPLSLTIAAGGTKTDLVGATGNDNNPNKYAFSEDPALGATMDASVINTILRAGTTVTLQAHQDLVISQAIDGTGGSSGGGLVLQAGNNVLINANITTNNGAVSITSGDDGGSGGGSGTDIVMADGVAVSVGSQSVTLTSDGTIVAHLAAASVTAITTGNGDITLTEADSVTVTSLDAGSGTINFNGGTFNLGAAEVINNSSKIAVNGATFALGNYNERVDTLTLVSGSITGTGTLTTPNTIQVQSGSISAVLLTAQGLTKTTAGTVTLSATNPYTGTTTVSAGTLLVNGSITTSPTSQVQVKVTGGVLGGSGTVCRVNATGGTVAPGSSPGILKVSGNYTMAAPAELAIEIGGETAGTQYDQVRVTGGSSVVTLGGATLTLTLTAAPTPGAAYAIIDNQGNNSVTGTFAGLAEGGTITAGYGGDTYTFHVTYQGNLGSDNLRNDVVLVAEGTPTAVYVDDDWTGATGTVVDGDQERSGTQSAVIGTNAFGTLTAAFTAAQSLGVGTVIVNEGDYTAEGTVTPPAGAAVTVQFVQGNSSITALSGGSDDALVLGGFDANHTTACTLTLGGGTIASQVSGTGGLTNTSGTLTLSSNGNTYSGDTIINGGTVLVTNTSGSATGTGDVTVTAGTLGGTGIISGTVTVNINGTISPGSPTSAIGTLAVGGLSFNGGTYRGQTSDNTNDAIVVNGTTTLADANAGHFQLLPSGTPDNLTQFHFIQTTTGITGTFAGITEGEPVTISGKTASYSYIGGLLGTNFTLSVEGSPTYSGTAGNDTFVVQRSDNGQKIEVWRNAVKIASFKPDAETKIEIYGLGGDDTLIVNFMNGDPIPEKGLTFHGDANTTQNPGDRLEVTDLGEGPDPYAFDSVTYNATGVGAGNLVLVHGISTSTITFDGLEPVTVVSAAGTATVNIDPTNTVAGPIVTTISDAPGSNMTVSTDVGLESFTFATPTVALIVNGDSADADTITVASVDADAPYAASLTINGLGGGTDVVNLNTALALGSATSTGDLSITATTINLNAATINTDAGPTNAGTVALAGAVVIGDGLSVVIDTDSVAGTDGSISLGSTLQGKAGGGTESVQFISGANTTTVTGAVGPDIDTLTLQANVAGATGAVTFNGAVTANALATFAQAYGVVLNAGGTITNDTTFLNTGTVTLGNDAGDNLTFTGGLDTTAASGTNIAGTVATTNTQMDLGATTLTADATLRSGSAAINIASATDGAGSFSLDAGSGTQTGTVTFTGNVTVNDLDTFSGAYNIVFQGTSSTIDTDTTFLNTGTVTLGDGAGDSITFTGGLDTTATSGTSIAGKVATTNTQMDLGATTLIADAGLTSGSGAINVASATDGASSFSLDVGDGVQTGTVTFTGNVTVNDLDTSSSAYNVAFLGTSNTIDTDTTFLNTGTVTLGNGVGDSCTFTGGLDTTAASGTNIAGTVETTNAQMDLGATTMTADATLRSGSGAINVASATDGASNFSLDVGDGTQTGTVTFTGNVTINDLDTFAAAYNVAFQGTGNTIDTDTTFLNTGTVTLGDGVGDSCTFTGGLDTTAASGTNIAGTVATTNTQMDLGATTMTADATLRSGSGAINVASATDGASSFSLDVGSVAQTGTVTFTGNVTINDVDTFAGAYNVAFHGTSNTVDTDTTFLNTGTVTLGDGVGDSCTFTGGLDTTAASGTNIAGTVETTNTQMDLGATTMTTDATLRSGSGAINVASATDGASSFSLDVGSAAQTGTVTFTGNVTISDLDTFASAYNVAFHGTSSTIDTDTTFLNTGTVTLGDGAADSCTFTGGLDTTAAAGTDIAGTVETTNTQMDLGATTMTADATLRSGSGAINVASVTDGASSHSLDVGSVAQTGTVTFTGGVTVNDLDTFASPYNVLFLGASNTIDTATAFVNTGTLTLGDADGDVLVFDGGLDTTAVGGAVRLHGQISSSDDGLTFGAVTLDGNTVLDTNATTAVGDITLGGVSDGAGSFSLTLETGAVAGADVNGTSVDVDTLALQNIGGTASFTANVTVATLTAAGTVNAVSLTGGANSVTNPVTFSNTGPLTLGDQNTDSFTFDGGVTATAPSGVTVAGTISSSDDAITLGDSDTGVALAANALIDTNAASTAGDVSLGAVTGGGYDLTLETGNGIANADVGGTSVSSVGTLLLQNIGGTVSLTGTVTVTTLTAGGTVANVSLTGSGTSITNACAPTNTGTLTLGDADGDTLTFNGGLNTTGVGGVVALHGQISSSDDALTFGAVALGGNTALDTNATATNTADIALGAVTGGAFNLTLETGNGIANANVNGTGVSNVGTLALQNVGGTASFAGNVSAATLTVPGTVNAVALTGATNSITNAVTFLNAGGVRLGDGGDEFLFNGGVTSTVSTTTVAGNVRTSGDTLQFGATVLQSDATLDTTNSGAVAAGDDVTLADVTGGSHALAVQAGTGGAVGLNGTVSGLSGVPALSITGGSLSAQAISASGNVIASLQNAIQLNAAVDAGAGRILLRANQDGAGAEAFTMNSGASLLTTSESAAPPAVSIVVGGSGAAHLTTITAGTVTGAVGVTAGGAIDDSLAGEGANITAYQTALRAAIGIGAGVVCDDQDVDVSVTILAAVTDSGNINVQVPGNLRIDTVDGLSGVTITNADGIATGNDQISLRAGGMLLVAAGNPVVNADGGAIRVLGQTGVLNADVRSGGSPATTTGGAIYVLMANGLTVNAVLSTELPAAPGSGTLMLGPQVTFTGPVAALVRLGDRNIVLDGGGLDMVIAAPAVPYAFDCHTVLFAHRDVIIDGVAVSTTAGHNLSILADVDNALLAGEGAYGGVVIRGAGGSVSSGNLLALQGTQVFAAGAGAGQAVFLDAAGNTATATGNLLIEGRTLVSNADVVLGGDVQSTQGNISVLSQDDVRQNAALRAVGTIDVWARNADNAGLGADGILMSAGAASHAGGNIRYAADNEGLARLGLLDAGAYLSVTATGSVLDSNAGALNLMGLGAMLRAGGSIGMSADGIETALDTLSAAANQNGGLVLAPAAGDGIYVMNTRALTVDAVGAPPTPLTVTRVTETTASMLAPCGQTILTDATFGTSGVTDAALSDVRTFGNNGHIVLVASGGDLTVNEGVANGADVTGGVVADGSGRILLAARQNIFVLVPDAGDVTLNAAVISGSGAISVLADDDVVQTDDGDTTLWQNGNIITTGGGTIDVRASNWWNDAGNNGITMGSNVLSQADSNIRYATDGNGGLWLAELRGGADVSLNVSGSVVDNNGAGTNVTAHNLRLNAGGSLGTSPDALEIAVDVVAAGANSNAAALPVPAAGDGIYLTEQDAIVVDAVGPLNVDRVQTDASTVLVSDATLSDLRTLGNNGHIVLVTLAGNLTVNEGLANGADVDGGVAAHGGGNVRLEANRQIALSDSGDITLNAAVLSGTGNISLLADDDVMQTDNGDALLRQNGNLVTGGGTIDVLAENLWSVGATNGISMASQTVSQAAGNVRYEALAQGGLQLAQLISDADVSLAIGGSITDSNGGTLNVTAVRLRMEAGGAIGTQAEALETAIAGALAAAANRDGSLATPPAAGDGIYLTEQDAVTIDAVAPVAVNRVQTDGTTVAVADAAAISDLRTLGNNGHIVLVTLGGDLTVNEGVANLADAQGGVVADGSGRIRLEANQNLAIIDSGDLLLNAAVASGTGAVSVLADDDIFQTDNGDADPRQNGNITTTGGGTIDVEAGNAWADAGPNGIVMGANTRGQADGNLRYAANNSGGVWLAVLQSGTAISVNASGSVIDNNGAATNVATNDLRLTAGGSLGTSLDAVETQVNVLAAAANSNAALVPGPAVGDGIYLSQQQAVTIDSVGPLAVARVQADATTTAVTDAALSDLRTLGNNGHIVLVVAGNMTINEGVANAADLPGGVSAHGAGNVLLSATGAATRDVVVNASVASAAGNLTVWADNDIRQQANFATGGPGTIDVYAANQNAGDSVSGLTVDGVTMQAGTATVTAGGNIRVEAANQGHLRLAQLTTPGGSIALVADGAVVDNDVPGAEDATVNLTAAAVRIDANSSAGTAGNFLETNIGTMAATVNQTTADPPAGLAPGDVIYGLYVHEVNPAADAGLTLGTVGPVPVNRVQTNGSTAVQTDAAALEGVLATNNDPKIQLRADHGNLNVQRTIETLGDGSSGGVTRLTGAVVLEAPGGAVTLNPLPTVLIKTGTGQISLIPTIGDVTVTPFTAPGGFEIIAGYPLCSVEIVTLTVNDPRGRNYRLDVDWAVGVPAESQLIYQNTPTNALTPSTTPTLPIDSETGIPPLNHTVHHDYHTDDITARANPTANIVTTFTVSFDFRGGAFSDSFVRNGIQLFQAGVPVTVHVHIDQTVDLRVPVMGIRSYAQVIEEEKKVVVAEPVFHPVRESSSALAESYEVIATLPGAAIDPLDHLELWRVTAQGRQLREVFVRRWADGDATVLDDLPGLFGALKNDHYRLYLVREDKRIMQFFNILLKDGIPLSPPQAEAVAPPQADAAPPPSLAQPPSSAVGAQAAAVDTIVPQGMAHETATVGAVTSAVDEELPESAAASDDTAGADLPVAATIGAALLVHPTQRVWERRIEQAMRAGRRRPLTKLARLCRRAVRPCG
jgi:hypothetical protein